VKNRNVDSRGISHLLTDMKRTYGVSRIYKQTSNVPMGYPAFFTNSIPHFLTGTIRHQLLAVLQSESVDLRLKLSEDLVMIQYLVI
jgi:hypothetical protein